MAVSKSKGTFYYFDIPSSPSGSPVIVDEDCRKMIKFLKKRKIEVIAPKNGMPDENIKKLGFEKNAYILTSDKKGFTDYEKALYIYPSTNPNTVYKMLETLIECERKCMKEMMRHGIFGYRNSDHSS